jgi:hypothetical protein
MFALAAIARPGSKPGNAALLAKSENLMRNSRLSILSVLLFIISSLFYLIQILDGHSFGRNTII